MKKLLLSLVALFTITFASAQTEPSYIAKGTIGVVPEGWENYPSLTDSISDIDVEVYGTDSIIIRDFCGVEGTDLVAVLDNDSTVNSYYCWYYRESIEGMEKYAYKSGTYHYVYTGLSDYYGMYLCTYTGYSALEMDSVKQTGSLACGYVTAFDSPTSSKTCGYYITWEPKPEVYTANSGVYSAWASNPCLSPEITDLQVEIYREDSVIVRDFLGVEGTDLCVTLDASGNVTAIFTLVNGEPVINYDSSYGAYSIYTGLTDESSYTSYAFYAASNYAYVWNGGILLLGYGYKGSDYTWGYYFIGWGDDKPVPTAISSVAAPADAVNAPVYNMAGQRVSANTKGLIIKNGKKYFVK